MKTPRDILMERHQTAAPKLDALRREVVAELNNKGTKEQSLLAAFVASLLRCPNKLWLELVWPCRRIWAGLAAIWVFIFAVNLSQRDPSEMMAQKTPPSPEMILTFRQQEILLAELAGQNEPQAAERPKTYSPRPSSERSFETMTA
ncbi:MAG TPA: hypothetical protein VMV89_01000 [Candidatus Paceibacterota bacterium]|nr:hypothetical protein [Candidatus Paceibacterota bacterium]